MSSTASTSISVSDLYILTDKTWSVYSSSPLYRLDYSEIYLKKLAKCLREQLAATISEKNKDIVSYKVFFEKIPGINYTENDGEAIMITVTKLNVSNSSIIYQGLFLSRGSKITGIGDFKNLTTLLCRCAKTTAVLVHAKLQKIFDCKIYPISLDSFAFKWLCVIFLDNMKTEDIADEITFTYSSKKDCDIHFKIPHSALLDLWACIQNTDMNEITDINVYEFFDIIENEFFHKTKIKVSDLNLHGLKMSKLLIKKPCKFRITDSYLLHYFLLFIQDFTN